MLPLVLLIWGSIIYQFFAFSNDEVVSNASNEYPNKPLQIKKKDTFSIKINPRDPFLGKMVNDEMTKGVKHKSINSNPKTKVELVWPQIKYKGIVADNKDRVKVYMLIINGKSHLMRKGDEIDKVFLKEGDRETIYVKYEGDIKVVFIQ